MKRIFLVLLTTTFAGFGIPSQADTLLLETLQANPPNSSGGLMRPNNGSSMAEVQGAFGGPTEEINWVGEPPITRWVYPTFTVYFEAEQVIHSVVHQATAAGSP